MKLSVAVRQEQGEFALVAATHVGIVRQPTETSEFRLQLR